jgi:hypothetical protein
LFHIISHRWDCAVLKSKLLLRQLCQHQRVHWCRVLAAFASSCIWRSKLFDRLVYTEQSSFGGIFIQDIMHSICICLQLQPDRPWHRCILPCILSSRRLSNSCSAFSQSSTRSS